MDYRPEFTTEQEHWICYQIGQWYLDWKDKIVAGAAFHNLGIAKEKLKIMLCEKTKSPDWKENVLTHLVGLLKKRNLELNEQEKNVILKILELDENR